jgi:hypothetical protein
MSLSWFGSIRKPFLTFCSRRFRLQLGSTSAGESDGADTNTYQDCSKRIACSWFSANPVYCLRSQYIYKHSPPCLFCIPGKVHLIAVNEDIGLYFNDCAAKDGREVSGIFVRISL